MSWIGMGIFMEYVIEMGKTSLGGNYISGAILIFSVSTTAMFQLVSLYIFIYFVVSYNYILSEMVEILKQRKNCSRIHQFLVQLYTKLDENVDEFNALFGLRLNLEVFYAFVYFLYYLYCILIMGQVMEDGIMIVVGINVGLLGVFVVSFYWFSSNTTGLEMKSRMMDKLLTRYGQNEDVKYGIKMVADFQVSLLFKN
jgi:hypothetical protein